MKKVTFWKSLFLLCALIVGSGNGWATDVTYTFTTKTWQSSSGNWSGTEGNAKETKGVQCLKDVTYTVTSPSSLSNISSIVVTYGTASNTTTSSKISIKVGSNSAVEKAVAGSSKTDATLTWNYNTAQTGSIEMVVKAKGASVYVKSVKVTYSAASLSSIAVTTPPTTTAYKIGDAFSAAGMVVTGTYSDASTAPITNYTMKIGDDAIANGDILTSAGNKTITITSGEKTTTQDITVAGVTNLVVKTAPTKTQYKYGETLNLTGLELTATYSDSETRNITEGFTAVPANGSELTASGNVTFTYYDAQCTQAYTVGTLSSLTYNSTGEGAFANTTYTEKDYFDPTGLVVTAHYSNGIEEVVTDYTLTPNTTTELKTTDTYVTASYTWAGTAQTVNIPITVNAGTKYKVSFDAGNGSYTGGDITETEYQGGITLPAATTSISGWTFAGWAEASISNTLVAPTLYAAGDTYKPTTNKTLYAAYKNSAVNHKVYTKATSIYDILDAGKAIIVYNSTGKILNNTLNGSIDAPVETDGKITPPTNSIFTIGGNNTDGITFSNTLGTIGTTTNTASVNAKIEYTNTNNLWIIEESTIGTNNFSLHNKRWTDAALQYNSNTWKVYNSTGYNGMTSYAMRIYIPSPTTAYNSNPSAIAVPTVAFADNTTKVLYVKNANEYTNAATATGTEKNIDYSSSDETIASVDENGAVTALKAGTAIITARIAAEAGVSAEATDTYIITVKDASTIASVKAVNTTTTAKAFTADLTDANITYVSGTRAYIQDASAAIYVSCATNDWAAGKKFNGAVSGKVKKSNGVWEISELTGTPVEGGSVPAALTDVAIADITAETYASYEGKKITLAGVTVTTAMASSATSGGEVSDGTNTIKIGAPATGINLVKDERGSVTGFVAQYNSAYRLNLYEQSQFVKTHNAPQNQDMAFTTASYNLDEETDAVTDFAGQAVTATTVKGTLTYSIKDGSDDLITSLNTSTGAVVLNGACGTATIVATAAAYDEYDEGTGYYTPYKELKKEYSITVRPRYSVTFSINGNTDEVRRQESYGAAITTPDVAAIGDYEFQGWSDTEVSKTNSKPTMTTGSSITPTTNKRVYAVYAIKTQTGTTDVEDQSYSKSAGTLTVGGTYTTNTGYYLLHEGGYVESAEFDLSIITKVVVYGGTYGGSDYNSLTIGDGTNKWKDVTVTGSSNTGTNEFTGGNALSGTGKLRITSTCGGTTNGVRVSGFKIYKSAPVYGYSNYTTAFNVDITIPASGYLSYCSPYKLDFSETNVKAYTASVDNTGTVTLTKVYVVPAEEGVVLFSSEAQTANEATDYTIPVTAEDASDVTGNQMVGVLTRTQVEWNPSDGVYNYILQQGEFRKATTPGGYLKANRAYLSTSYDVTAAGARPLTIVFEGETTRISNVVANDNFDDNAPMYNLAGQKVGKSYKGIVIQNGKKILKK